MADDQTNSGPFGPADMIHALRITGQPCDDNGETCDGSSVLYIRGRYLCGPCLRSHGFQCRADDHSTAAAAWRATQKET